MNTNTVQSIYLKYFQSKNLNRKKYFIFLDFAKNLRDVKNELSKYVCEHYEDFKDLSQYQFRDRLRELFPDKLTSYFYHSAYIQIHSAYEAKFKAIDKKLTFKKQKLVKTEYYKKNTKDHKAGDIKKEIYKNYEDSETRTLSFLAKWDYSSEKDVLEYITEQTKSEKADKAKRFTEILEYINSHNFEELKKIALERKKAVYDEYLKPCNFTSLTFEGRMTYLNNEFLTFSKNKTNCNAYIKISIFPRKFINIPVMFSKEHHLDISNYQKNLENHKPQTYSYRIEFLEDIKEIKIAYGIDNDRTYYVPTEITLENSYALDVNSADNLFTGSDGKQFNIDRKLVNKLEQLLLETDKYKKEHKVKTLPIESQSQIDDLKRRIKDQIIRLIVEVCKYIKDSGKENIVMENLTGNFGKSRATTENKLNYNRTNDNVLHLSSLKDEILHIAQNYELSVNFVPSPYTSKMCSKCHNIDDKNRNQRDFKCTECGFETHADFNAALNILNIFVDEQLREKLLKVNNIGYYEPKKNFTTDEVRDVYSKLYKL